jgi:hypothetical protein
VECCELASIIIASEGLPAVQQVVDKEAPDAKKSSESFRPAEFTKEVLIDPSSSDGKVEHIGAALSPKLESALIDFLYVNKDIFVSKPSNMPSIPREVIEHALWIKLGSKPMKQCMRRFDEEKRRAIGEEITKLLAARFIREVYHPEWLANLILVKKKMGNGGCVLTI